MASSAENGTHNESPSMDAGQNLRKYDEKLKIHVNTILLLWQGTPPVMD